STELKVTQTLWAAGQTVLGAVVAALVALLFAGLKPRDFLLRSIDERLASVEDLLNCYAAGQRVTEDTAKKLTRMAMLGTSRLRGNIQRSGYSPYYAEQMGVVIALVGRLVDFAASLLSLDVQASDEDRNRIKLLAQNIANLRADLLAGRIPRLAARSKTSFSPREGTRPTRLPWKSACVVGPVPSPGDFLNGLLGQTPVDGHTSSTMPVLGQLERTVSL